MIVWNDVINVAPFAASIATGMQAALLGYVQTQVDDDAWGEYADMGRAYLAAHLASIRNNSGLVTAEGVGPLTTSYAVPAMARSGLALSVYGIEYERIMRLAVGPCAVVP